MCVYAAHTIYRTNNWLTESNDENKINERLNAVEKRMNLWYLPTTEIAAATTELTTTVTVNDQTTAADIELTTVTDEVTESQAQTGQYDLRRVS